MAVSSVTQANVAQAGVGSPNLAPNSAPRDRASAQAAERSAAAPRPPETKPPSREAADVRLSAEGRARAARDVQQKEIAAAAQNASQQRQQQSEAASRTAARGVAAYQRVFDL